MNNHTFQWLKARGYRVCQIQRLYLIVSRDGLMMSVRRDQLDALVGPEQHVNCRCVSVPAIRDPYADRTPGTMSFSELMLSLGGARA